MVNALLTQIDLLRRRRNVLVMATSNLTNAIGTGADGEKKGGESEAKTKVASRVLCGDVTDEAFLDRADIKQFVGLPSRAAIYQILRTCLFELMRVGIVAPPVSGASVGVQGKADLTQSGGHVGIALASQTPLMERQVVEYLQEPQARNDSARASLRLLAIAERCQVRAPPSGRSMRSALTQREYATGAPPMAPTQGMSGRAIRKMPFLAHAYFVQAPACTLEQFLDAMERATERERQSVQALGLKNDKK